MEREKELLKAYGATEVKPYFIAENYGYIFSLEATRCDARHWRNIYGEKVDYWEIEPAGGQVDAETRKKIKELEQALEKL